MSDLVLSGEGHIGSGEAERLGGAMDVEDVNVVAAVSYYYYESSCMVMLRKNAHDTALLSNITAAR